MFKEKKSGSSPMAAVDTVIGSACRIQGDVAGEQSVKIDGEVLGNILVSAAVVVGESGRVKGDVRCDDLVVFGRVEGQVEVRRLQLKNTAQVVGNIHTQVLLVEEGAVYAGDVRMERSATAGASMNAGE